jgi:hypothetical protein
MPFSFKNLINELVKSVSVDSYFERFPEKDEIVPPIRKANPEKRKIRPNKTRISANHLGTLFFSSHIIGCSQIMLMNSASKKGVITDFA